MLGRFKMTIDECLAQYRSFMTDVFPEKKSTPILWGGRYDSKKLESIIKQLTKKRLGDENAKLLDDASNKDPCKV
jgi:hypothetical protein